MVATLLQDLVIRISLNVVQLDYFYDVKRMEQGINE
jgi:hypothetical protein